MTPNHTERRARIVGRVLRLVLGVALTWLMYEVVRSADSAFNVRAASALIGLTGFYAAIHFVVSRHGPTLNPWLGAALALVPVALLYVLGGPVGRVASLAYMGVSLVLQGIRGDGGCEVMSIPSIVFGKRTHLVCLVFSPVDSVEEYLADRAKRPDRN